MLVEDGLADTGAICDLIHRCGVIARLCEGFKGGSEELGAAFIAGQSRFLFRIDGFVIDDFEIVRCALLSAHVGDSSPAMR